MESRIDAPAQFGEFRFRNSHMLQRAAFVSCLVALPGSDSIIHSSITEPGHPCVTMSGNAFYSRRLRHSRAIGRQDTICAKVEAKLNTRTGRRGSAQTAFSAAEEDFEVAKISFRCCVASTIGVGEGLDGHA